MPTERTGTSGQSRKGCAHTVTPPAWAVVDWTELLPPNDAPANEDTERDLILWHLLRRLNDWAALNDLRDDPRLGDREPREYRRAAAPAPVVEDLLRDLSSLNARTDRQSVVTAALGVSIWAESSGKTLLALRFAEAAAACDAFDPAPANVAGRLARTIGMAHRADLWYSRGIGLARARRWSACYVRAHIGYGTLHKEIGRTDRALELFSRGSWRAQKTGIKWLAGEVTHDMLLLAISQRAFTQAEKYAARALAIYPKHHDRMPALVHDIGLLCARQSAFTLAYPLLARVVGLVPKPHEKLIVWSTLAYSAAGAEELEAYNEARAAVLEMVERFPGAGPVTMVNLAFAAHVRRDWSGAADFARRALDLAGSNSIHSEAVRYARKLLLDVDRRTPAGPSSGPVPHSGEATALRPLYDMCLRLITRWHGRTWRERRHQAKAGAFGAA